MAIDAIILTAGLADPVDNSFSMLHLFLDASLVVKAVMGLLLIMSLWTWTIIFDKWFSIGDTVKKARQFEESFWTGSAPDDMAERISDKQSDAMARVFAASKREWRESTRAKELSPKQGEALVERADRLYRAAIDRELSRAESGLGTLATVGSSAPFVGLFGTVWGIMNSFLAIDQSGDANLAVVAPGVAEALFATALGLMAAIPAVVFYNKFAGDLGKLSDRMETFTQELLVRLSRRVTELGD